MKHINYEIKARVSKEQQEIIREYLLKNKAEFKGEDNQTDTYFKVEEGRLKLRKSNLENSLIYYDREDSLEAKKSNVEIYNLMASSYLERITKQTHDVLVEVKKKREIYFIKNIKFHIDDVEGLGTFVEIEANDKSGEVSEKALEEQCDFYKYVFKIRDSDLISNSYSDMLLENMK